MQAACYDLHRMSAPKALAAATRTRILDVAERLVQMRGFNGFSYADIAAEVGITKASLHYHFATKAELGRTLIERYTEAFGAALQQIEASRADAHARLQAYAKLYADVLAEKRMCLCGMVAAEYGTLPPPMQDAIRVFFEFNERWLATLLEEGRAKGSLHLKVPPREAARMLVGALEGEMLIARAYGDPQRFVSAAALLLAQLRPDGTRGRRGAGIGPAIRPAVRHPPDRRRTARVAAATRVRSAGAPRARSR
jgi:TetR/AcrR family transcriptional regulator, transcriptional repressor for nem operon